MPVNDPSPEKRPEPEDERAAARRRRLAAAFGEVLPEGTSDERGEGWGERTGESGDEWLRGEVPPHHG